MNIETGKITAAIAADTPSRGDAEAALDTLRRLAAHDPGTAAELGVSVNGDMLNRSYPADFIPDQEYKASMPDLQNGPESLIKGAKRQIQHVGISNFRLPIRYHTRDNGDLTLETSVTGTVSLEAEKKGIARRE